jgi:preprotein translocase subunit SecE
VLGVQVPPDLPVRRIMVKKKRSNFLADVWYELTTKVVWPTWSRLRMALAIVVGFIMIWAVLLWAFDSAFIYMQDRIVDSERTRQEYEAIMEANRPAETPEEGEESATPGLPEGMEFPVETTTPETNQ